MLPLDTHFHLFVPGQPVPQGSKTAFVNKSTGRPVVVDKDVRLPQWRMKITAHAIDKQAEYMHTAPAFYATLPLSGPIGVRVDFVMPRPQSHYWAVSRNHPVEGELREDAPKYPASMPDADKLLRAVFDALTDAQVWKDDGQVVWVQTSKHYVGPTWPDGVGVHIELGVMR
jgi:Holliday junction resolvase RusA-like endonuclease